MKQRFLAAAVLALALALFLVPVSAAAQMRVFEQSMGRLKARLPRSTFDGKTLKITTYKQLTQVANFLKQYRANLDKAIDSWNKLIKTARTQARRNALVANQAYFKALAAEVQAKARVIKPTKAAAPSPQKKISLSDVYVGPDVGKGKPFIVDTIGRKETRFRAWPSPGTKAKPSRWSAKLEFWVKYDQIAGGDVVLIEVLKGRKKLGPPTACRPSKVLGQYQLALFDCKAPKTRKWETLFSSAGDHTINLTYKKPIEGKQFKNFATLHVRVKKLLHGASNNPAVTWGTDYDQTLGVSTIEEAVTSSARNSVGHTMVAMNAAFRKEIAGVVIRTWVKRAERMGSVSLTCLYKGKRVAEGRLINSDDFDYWSFVRKGSPKRDKASWIQLAFDVGMIRFRPGPGGSRGSYGQKPHWLSDSPGEYKCVVLDGGEVVKELFFAVGNEGDIIKPACQLKSMNTLSTVTLLRAKDRKLSDTKYDKAISKKRAFEGRVKWARGCPPR